jgi:3-oxoadipate enol-lactonase
MKRPIYYEVCGSGPAIVLIHGLGGNHAAWFQQVASLARRYTVVTLSQRGFAPSGGDRTAYDVRRYVSDLVSVMDAANVSRAVVVGQSMGGWTALGAALHAPARVSGLVLADTTGGISDSRIAAHLRKMTAQAEKLRTNPLPLGVHPALAADFSRSRPDMGYLYQTLSTFGSPPPDAIANHLARSTVSYSELKNLRIPTLFVVGTDDRLFPPDLVRHAASGVRKVEVSELGAAGHSAYYENPGLWNAVVRGFIERRVR